MNKNTEYNEKEWFNAIAQDDAEKIEQLYSQLDNQSKKEILNIYHKKTCVKSLQYALFKNSFKVIDYFFKQSEIDIYLLDKDSAQATVLCNLVSKGDDNLVNQLLNKINANLIINEPDFMGKTVLANAISNKKIHLNTIKKLVQLGANLNALDNGENTIAHYLAYTKGRSIKDLHYLIKNKVALNELNQNNKTPLDIAIHMGNKKFFIELLKHITINHNNIECLHFAATNNKKEAIEILIHSPHNLDKAFKYAIKNLDDNKHSEIKEWLKSYYEQYQLNKVVKLATSHQTQTHSTSLVKKIKI